MRKPRLRLGADDVLTADAQDVTIDAESAVGDQEGDCLGDIARLATLLQRVHASIPEVEAMVAIRGAFSKALWFSSCSFIFS